MIDQFNRERLGDLLADPREDLDFEIKNWLDVSGNNSDKATLAKAMLAIANHGGGFVALGLEETGEGVLEASNRPATLDHYNQDVINGIVQRYCDPPFHCAVHLVRSPSGAIFPVIRVPGGHRVPILARRNSPNGTTVRQNAVYVRKPGPRSETPQRGEEWHALLARCVREQRDALVSEIRDLIVGAVPQVDARPEEDSLENWMDESFARWAELIEPVPEDVGARFPYGHYRLGYEILGDARGVTMAELPGVLRRSVARYTGRPPFSFPTREEIAPYPYGGAVECWLAGDPGQPFELSDPCDSDFWRIRPNGLAFLMRGYQEDGRDIQRAGRMQVAPGTLFEITLPIWRVGETLLQAERLAAILFEGPTTIRFVAVFTGLAGRRLSISRPRRHVSAGWVAREDSFSNLTHIETRTISPNLPEIIHPLLSPLYAQFGFFHLRMDFVVDELARMRGVRG